MQQVFGVANLLLRNDAETRKRDLRMRTYKVTEKEAWYGIISLVRSDPFLLFIKLFYCSFTDIRRIVWISLTDVDN